MLEPRDHQYVEIGRIARSHGSDGTVLMIPAFKAPNLFDEIDLVRLQNSRGDLIPARIGSVRIQQKNNRLSFFIKFDHITDRNEAETLKNRSVFANREAVSLESKANAADLTSFNVMDENGTEIGAVEEILNNTAQAILKVETDEGQILIPFVEEYIAETDEKHQRIRCRNLNQLSSLHDAY